jgi:hypothetical protein
MFDKVSEAAERLAVHVSRRDFFGWAGKSALALAGLLAMGGTVRADKTCGLVACKSNQQPCGLTGLCCPGGCICVGDPCYPDNPPSGCAPKGGPGTPGCL